GRQVGALVEPDDRLVDAAPLGQGHHLVDQAVLGAAGAGQRGDDVDDGEVAHACGPKVDPAQAATAAIIACWVSTLVRPCTRPGTRVTVTRSPAWARTGPSSVARARAKSAP